MSSYESLINQIIFDSSLTNKEKSSLLTELFNESNKQKEQIHKGTFDFASHPDDMNALESQCARDYTNEIWNKLEKDSRKDLVCAYFYSAQVNEIGDDQSTPIGKFTKTVEYEIKAKVFEGFSRENLKKRLGVKNKNDSLFESNLDSLEKKGELSLGLGQMFHLLIDALKLDGRSNYAVELSKYLTNNDWNTDLLSRRCDKKCLLDYSSEYRNASHHGRIKDREKTNKCKLETRKILIWFLDPLNGD